MNKIKITIGLLLSAAALSAGKVTVSWDYGDRTLVSHFNVYWSPFDSSSGVAFGPTNVVSTLDVQAVITGVPNNTDHLWWATAVSTNGVESLPSNQVIQPKAPERLKVE